MVMPSAPGVNVVLPTTKDDGFAVIDWPPTLVMTWLGVGVATLARLRE